MLRSLAAWGRTFMLDLAIGWLFIKIQVQMWLFERRKGTVLDIWNALPPDHPLLIFEGVTFKVKELRERANQVSHWLVEQGVRRGDVVGVLMKNSPELVVLPLAVAQVGATTALLNAGLKGNSLTHCIEITKASLVLAQPGVAGEGMVPFSFATVSQHPTSPPLPTQPTRFYSYIYSSGTTGLPKACKITHSREYSGWIFFAQVARIATGERIYSCLPLYHSAGSTALGGALVRQATLVLGERFSATGFFDEVSSTQCTVVVYIGEMCRYLLHAYRDGRPVPKHRIRVAFGNGNRVTNEFMRKFGIPTVAEYYSSTEGTITIFSDTLPGAVGYLPWYTKYVYPIIAVKCDENGEPVRGPNGLCVECKADEVGELVGYVSDANLLCNFEGYTDTQASSKKILRNVAKRGDTWFRSGDLMRIDAQGYVWFVDRAGDTFRWKSENVSTTEVENVIASCFSATCPVVFGVEIPGQDGRAGMACVKEEGWDCDTFYDALARNLAPFALPVFVRVVSEGSDIPLTSTHKPVKALLQSAGYDPTHVKDPLYIRQETRYVPYTAELHARLLKGALRL